MNKTEEVQPPSKTGLATAGHVGPRLPKKALAVTVVLALVVAAWIAWNAWGKASTPDARPVGPPGGPPAEVAANAGSGEPGVQPGEVIGAQPGETAPDFTVPTLDGGTFSLAAQRGKPAVLFFMAYWCGSCLPEAQALAQLQEEYGEGISIVAIDLDPSSTPETLGQFKQAAGSGAYTWAFDIGQQVAVAYEVQTLDTTLVLDASGRVVYRDAFVTSYETLKEVLAKLQP
ncbi:MAG: TlpA family protein disulfide reductase [Chloroflexi bacterium]|nr:TlpA family protein disulfide reductase [Chloroflexota bacterium]MCI0575041.1 TlpA family protein disulfide reductase [Chloroflexota bacterium]MCI0645124.1 TlpA family protein disulfide reductase [Chloroflexota bacterium]MCI0726793.1 TlpA family protein disulfide reductase [Chloroflexota bacterium]